MKTKLNWIEHDGSNEAIGEGILCIWLPVSADIFPPNANFITGGFVLSNNLHLDHDVVKYAILDTGD